MLLSEECDKKLMKYREEEREEIFLLKEEKKHLQQAIRQLTNQNQNLEATIQRVNAPRQLSLILIVRSSCKKKWPNVTNSIEKNWTLENC